MAELKNINVVDNFDEFKDAMREFLIERKEGVQEVPNTIKTYTANLKKIITLNKVKTLAQVAVIPSARIKKVLRESDATPASQSAYLNALVSVLKLYDDDEITKSPDFKKTVSLNTEMGKESSKRMDENVANITVPDDFDKKADAYIKKKMGTRNAVVVALFAKAPPIRAHVLENCLIATTARQKNALYKGRKNAVFYIDSSLDKAELFVPAELNKVKTFHFLSVYVEADVREALFAYLETEEPEKYLFENASGGSLKVQAIDNLIKDSFREAKLGSLGTQKLRRIYSTRTQSNPMLTKAQKEVLASRMNHSVQMDMAYNVHSFVVRTREAEEVVQQLGKEVERFVLKISNIADVAKLKEELRQLKSYVDAI